MIETLRAFNDLIRQGKVLYFGVSEWTAKQISQALHIADELGLDRLIVNHAQYNLLWRPVEQELTPLCAAQGVGQSASWSVVRVWEHESLQASLQRVEEAMTSAAQRRVTAK